MEGETTNAPNPTLRQLFGGAILVELPTEFVDVSNVRDVPDHQEVFANQDTDQSVIIEILERENSIKKPEDCVAYFFNDLAEHNDCKPEDAKILTCQNLTNEVNTECDSPTNETLPSTTNYSSSHLEQMLRTEKQLPLVRRAMESTLGQVEVCCIIGRQMVSKFREAESAKNEILVYLAVIRLPKFSTDVLVAMNVPTQISAQSSSATAVDSQQFQIFSADKLEAVAKKSSTLPGLSVFEKVLTTFEIVNTELFG